MADWIETATGKILNLDQASYIAVADSNQRQGRHAVLVYFGSHAHFVDDFPTREDAAWLARELAFGDREVRMFD